MKKNMLIKMKLLILFFFSALLFFQGQMVYSQKNLKYKDVYKIVEEKSKEEAYSLLLVYQKQDPFFANTYLQLGMLAQFWSKDYDALTNIRDVEFFIYNTNLYYGLALSKIDQKEIRKNEKLYLNIERFRGRDKVEYDEIRSFIQEQIDANNEYERNVRIVTRLFNSSIGHYNNCIRIFKEINTSNNKIKDIYLTANAAFISKLKELENSFDSAIYYLQNYQTAIKNYPIKNYNQKYKLLPIETYRLHGLTGSDFLKDEIPIWNYGLWVKNVRHIIENEIDDIRQSISKTDQELNENIAFLSETRDYRVDFQKQKVDDRLKFKIGKFDHQSILLELFALKEKKIDFFATLKDPVINPKDTGEYSILLKARHLDNIIQKKEECDSMNTQLLNHISTYEINKYSDYFSKNYGGEQGFRNYLKNETSLYHSKLNTAFNNMKEYLAKNLGSEHGKKDSVLYKQSAIYLKRNPVDFKNLSANVYYTTDFAVNQSGDYFITGYMQEGTNPAYPFVAMTNKIKDIKWLKTIPSTQPINSTGVRLLIKEDGCDVLVHTPLDSEGLNQIYVFDMEGKQKDKFDIGIAAFPRYFFLDEINQMYTLVFKGYKQNQFECLGDDLILSRFDALLKKEIWKLVLPVKGNFVDLLTMNQNHFIITNFNAFVSDSLSLVSSAGRAPHKTNSLVFIINENGKLVNHIPVLKTNPFYITNTLKLNSNTLCLMGFTGELQNVENIGVREPGELVYLLLDPEGKVSYDNHK
jgi:hypothetical protein